MKLKKVSKFMTAFVLSLTMICTAMPLNVNAETMQEPEVDYDFDGKQEYPKILFQYDEYGHQFMTLLSMQMVRRIGMENDYISNEIDINPFKYRGSDVRVVDLNPKDKQKEIVIDYSEDGAQSYAEVFSFKNGTLTKLATIDTYPGFTNGRTIESSMNKKTNQLEIFSCSFYPFQHTYYRKYKLENGKLKDVTPNETNANIFDKPLKIKAKKSIKVLNQKMNKKLFYINSGETLTVLATNRKSQYIKVKNSAGKIGYVPITTKEWRNDMDFDRGYGDHSLKQYPNISMYEMFDDLPSFN